MVVRNGSNSETGKYTSTENKITQNEMDKNSSINNSNKDNVASGDSPSCWKSPQVYNQHYGVPGRNQGLLASNQRRYSLGRRQGITEGCEKNCVFLFGR